MSKIQLNDTMMESIVKMAEGNPGAVNVLMRIIQKAEEIDPENAFGPLGVLLNLDTFEIYGSAIYVLWKDKCGSNVRNLLMLIRATQMGFLPTMELQRMAADQMGQVNLSIEKWDKLDQKVCKDLPQFQPAGDSHE